VERKDVADWNKHFLVMEIDGTRPERISKEEFVRCSQGECDNFKPASRGCEDLEQIKKDNQ